MVTAAELADELLAADFATHPIGASLLGFPDHADRLPDLSEAGDEAARVRFADIAARATALDPGGLTVEDRLTRAVVLHQAGATLDQLASRAVEYTVTDYASAAVIELLWGLSMISVAEPPYTDGYLARLAALPQTIGVVADRHRAGIAAGRVPVRYLVEAALAHFDRYLANRDGDPLRRPRPADDATADRFTTERDRLLDTAVRPAIARYREFLAAEVLPHGRPDDRVGLCWLPDGTAIYTRLARLHTTTDRSPDDLHRTGLETVAALAGEYAEIGSMVFGTRNLDEIFNRLRNDPALRWKDEDELLDAARTAIGRAEQAAPRWFGALPARPCVVSAVPADEAPGAPGAYYLEAAMDGSRQGTYFANTHQVTGRARQLSEATAFHEAVPGHHLQISIAQGLTSLPMLRRLAQVTAYDEGWGLYAERLADEMGLYSDPVSRLGMLNLDSMRAARLVVDTGMHAKGWSRRQAVEYMRANTALTPVEVDGEVDRYIADPGQALAYMVGRLEIVRIRQRAEETLGDRFDIRAFHDTVLGSGALPLSVLSQLVDAWTEQAR